MSSYALITGASKGIGRSLAQALAKRQYNLLLAARTEQALQAMAATLSAEYNISVHYLAIDLTLPGAALQVYEWCVQQKWDISLLVNNAGYGLWGYFNELPLAAHQNMLQLNMQLPVELSYHMIPLLKAQPQAYILNVSSSAAYQAIPAMALYAASKAFVLSFTRALRHELKRTSVSVSCLCPGPVNTHFLERAGMENVPHIKAAAEKYGMHPDRAAAIALKGLFAKKAEIIPGGLNKLAVLGARLLPKNLVENIAAGFYIDK